MANISLSGEDIFLLNGKSYFIIDALYLNDVKDELAGVDIDNLETYMKEKIFPYTETPFAVISLNNSGEERRRIEIKKIKKVEYDDIDSRCFSTDTGLVVMIERSIFFNLLRHFDYNKLVGGLNEPINRLYWSELEGEHDAYTCGLVLSPGVNSGFDFVGSGLYKLEL